MIENRVGVTGRIALVILILTKFLLQYIAIDPIYELHRDEYLHLDLGNHLAWGYTSVPPVTGVVSYIINLLGGAVFWVKFFPALFGALLILVVWKTIETLGGRLYALVLGCTGVLLSVLVRVDVLFQPTSIDFLCWTLLLYVIIRILKDGESKWFYIGALVFALGFLNKYNIGFLVFGLLLALVLSEQRRIFVSRRTYYTMGLAFILILPNMIWQYQNDFPVVRHLSTLADTQLVNVNRMDFLKEQLFFFTGSLIVLLAGLISFWSYNKFKPYRPLFWTFIFVLAIFTYLKAKNYYAIGLYPVFLAFGAVYIETLLAKSWLKYLRLPLLLLPIVTFILMMPLTLPVLSPDEVLERKELFDELNLTRWEDGEIHHIPQDYADMLGWRELAGIVDSALTLVDDKSKTLIQCDNYGQAGAVNYYSKRRSNEALSMNADYIYWYPLDEMDIQHCILVKETTFDKEELDFVIELFENYRYIGEIKNPNAREKGTKVYLFEVARESIKNVLENEINNRIYSY